MKQQKALGAKIADALDKAKAKPKPKLPAPRIELFQGKDDKWRFRLILKNGKIANHPYESKRNANKGVNAMISAIQEIIDKDPRNLVFVIGKDGLVEV